MIRKRLPVHAPLHLVVGALALALFTGCPKDEYDPQTWIDKLEDPAEAMDAVRRLQELKEPVAIKPLAEAWMSGKLQGQSKVLRTVVSLADQPDKEGGPFWDDALPALHKAVEEFEIGNQRSLDDAVYAADALGRAGNPESVTILINAATKKMNKRSKANRVRLAAVKALGNFGDKPAAVNALIKILETAIKDQPINLNGAAIIALGNAKAGSAVEPLLKTAFQIPPLFQQVSLAMAKIGNPAVKPTLRLLRGEHKELNEYAKKNNFNNDCKKGDIKTCSSPGGLEYKAAILLGDLRAKEAVPDLIRMLGDKEADKISYFDPRTGLPGPTTHAAFLDALVKIGDPKATPVLREYMTAKTTDDSFRHAAIERYSQIARETDSLKWLATKIKDDGEEEQIRKASAMAYGRLVQTKEQLEPLQFMIDRYKKEADKIKADAAKATDKKEKERLEGDAKGYVGLVNLFEQHIARAKPGIECGAKAACYSKLADTKPSELIKKLGINISGKESKTKTVSMGIAVKERSLLELSKLADKAQDQLPAVLNAVAQQDRITREASLRFLQRLDKCPGCVARLDEVIEKQKDQSALTQLTHDTRLVRAYLARTHGEPKPQPKKKEEAAAE